MDPTIIAVAQHFEGRLDPITYELVACALEIKQLRPMEVKAVIIGDDIEGLAREIADNTGLDVIAIQETNLSVYNAEAYKTILGNLLRDSHAAYVCIGHTSQGWDYAPALAIGLCAACVTGVERIIENDGRICFTRAMCNGKILANVISKTDTTVLTIQPGTFKSTGLNSRMPGSVDIRKWSVDSRFSRSMGIKRTQGQDSALSEAEVIVSAGKGIGKKENLALVYRLADLFTKSVVGGSRPVCDMGWLEYRRQIGLTGATVTPKLYLACGISGASQHLAGMRGAGFIVAINTDPKAAIFNSADVCIVEDLTTFIPVFIKEYEKKKNSH
jgi:electron transfer flavoprotein alpha subunit